MAIVVAIIGVVTPYLAKFIKSNKTAQTLVDILPTLAKDAVVAMQKLGVTTYIEGEVKKSKAGKIVEAALKNLGFTETDETTITNAIESAYASLTADGTLATYMQATAETEAEKKAAELKQAQADLATAQAKVTSLTQA
nr:phage holin [Paucilactobacillus suebicus]